ncbi:hypothetical protein EJ08DRAFT_317663 [Tothia fuscella]|uniref:C2H2-type domain-containing protein n=1 Tax=Tothia fuscella TaxID=1048955 RepID=A0A9P4NNF2_9PEZI|nr:hypothetical protein EJ08DRAFT_317663 [Tothia fuscella]
MAITGGREAVYDQRRTTIAAEDQIDTNKTNLDVLVYGPYTLRDERNIVAAFFSHRSPEHRERTLSELRRMFPQNNVDGFGSEPAAAAGDDHGIEEPVTNPETADSRSSELSETPEILSGEAEEEPVQFRKDVKGKGRAKNPTSDEAEEDPVPLRKNVKGKGRARSPPSDEAKDNSRPPRKQVRGKDRAKGPKKTGKKSTKEERRYTCEACSKSYSRKDHLVRHRSQAHSDVRPFECTVSGCTNTLGFRRRHNRYAHLREVHGREPLANAGGDGEDEDEDSDEDQDNEDDNNEDGDEVEDDEDLRRERMGLPPSRRSGHKRK